MINRDVRYYQNRIDLMESRNGRNNASIVRKLKRKIRNLQNSN